MTTTTKRRILGGVAATFLTIGLFWAYQRYAKASQLDELNRLSAQFREAPRGKNEELMKKFRVQMEKLTPDERMDFFEKGMDDRIDEYFKKSPAERKAWLDEMSKNRRRFGGPPGKGQRPTVKGKTATAKGKTLAKAKTGTASGKGQWAGRGGGGRGGPSGGGGMGGGRGRGGSPEQRAQRRRERLDKTSPEQRAKRAEFFAAMRGGRGGGGFGGGGRR